MSGPQFVFIQERADRSARTTPISSTMILETVNSTAIHAVGYDWDRHVLEIIFTGGGIYLFGDVPPSVFMGLLRSPSKGNFFQDHIRGRFPIRRLGRQRGSWNRRTRPSDGAAPMPRADA